MAPKEISAIVAEDMRILQLQGKREGVQDHEKKQVKYFHYVHVSWQRMLPGLGLGYEYQAKSTAEIKHLAKFQY